MLICCESGSQRQLHWFFVVKIVFHDEIIKLKFITKFCENNKQVSI